MKSTPIIFSLASLGFGGNLSQSFFVNNPSILLRPDKYNKRSKVITAAGHEQKANSAIFIRSSNIASKNNHKII